MPRYSPRFDEPPSPWKSALLILGCAASLLLGLWLSSAFGADNVTPQQHGVLANSFATGTVNNAVTITLTPSAAQRVRLYSFTAFCSAGNASASVTNAGTTLWLSDVNYLSASTRITNFQPALTGPLGGILTVTMRACGGSAFGNLSVQADYDSP